MPTAHAIKPVGTHILVPSLGVQWREPPHNLWVLIGHDSVQIGGIVVAIRDLIAVDITAVSGVRICYEFDDGLQTNKE